MRVAFTSDLHVEHHPPLVDVLARRLDALAPDVLVVAGDVSHDLQVIESTLRVLSPHAGLRALYVPGNHELWVDRAAGANSRDRYLDALPECAARAGFDYLPAGPVELAGASFVGQTGWFDYSLRNRARDAEIPLETYRQKRYGALRWNDGVRVRWPDETGARLSDEELTAWMVDRLRADLARAKAGPRIVVTHHLPFADLVFVRGTLPWDYLNAFMGSRALGEVILAAPAVRRVVSGHTHARRRALLSAVDGAQVVAETSPIGYPREYAGDLSQRVVHRISTFVV